MGKVGKSSYLFHHVYFNSNSSVVGKREHDGPLGSYFDKYYNNYDCNEKSFEKAEIRMLKDSIKIALEKSNIKANDVSVCFSGDLNNQIVASSYALRDISIPYMGIYNACANLTEGMFLSSLFVEAFGGYALNCFSSHRLTAERTYRYPNEYGMQRAETFTTTVTGAGSVILSSRQSCIKVTKATIGSVIDGMEKDPQDMGCAMAPACYFTIKRHLLDFNLHLEDYDLIFTGDLSTYGYELLTKLFLEDNIDIKSKIVDCGMLIYNKNQDMKSGGSGCGCIGASLSYIIKLLTTGKVKNVLLLATGALMSPNILAQKETIPTICHAIALEVD